MRQQRISLSAGVAATGYSLVLPSPWRRIPLRGGTQAAIKGILDEVFRGLPRDKLAPYKYEIKQWLNRAAVTARQGGGTELYLPVGLKEDSLISASFVVAEFPLESPGQADPAVVAAELAAAEEGAQEVTVRGAPGVRTERTAEADPGAGVEYASRCVTYLVNVPGSPSRWLSIAFSTLGAGNPDDDFAQLLVQLFDAIMLTFQWTLPKSSTGQEN
jgi:hypothetical protein